METSQYSTSSSLERILRKYPVILQLLRFSAIGVLNTTLDFLILNIISKWLGVDSGLRLGGINILGFSAAVVQSYFWNRHWTFAESLSNLTWKQNFIRLLLVGITSGLVMALILVGSGYSAPPWYYLILLGIFLFAQIIMWFSFGFNTTVTAGPDIQFVKFLLISVIGLVLNSVILSLVSNFLSTSSLASTDALKNAAKIVATGVSLVWNFIGYKLVVFKK